MSVDLPSSWSSKQDWGPRAAVFGRRYRGKKACSISSDRTRHVCRVNSNLRWRKGTLLPWRPQRPGLEVLRGPRGRPLDSGGAWPSCGATAAPDLLTDTIRAVMCVNDVSEGQHVPCRYRAIASHRVTRKEHQGPGRTAWDSATGPLNPRKRAGGFGEYPPPFPWMPLRWNRERELEPPHWEVTVTWRTLWWRTSSSIWW